MLAPLSLMTAGQFTLVSLTLSSVTAVFKSTGTTTINTSQTKGRRSPLRCSYAAAVVDMEHFSHGRGLRDH